MDQRVEPYGSADLSALIVDRDAETRSTLRDILSSSGFSSMAECPDGLNGLETLRTFQADIVICDWKMSPMPGIEFLQAVRSGHVGSNPNVPFLMLAEKCELDHVVEAYGTGAIGFLDKPYNPAALLQRVEAIIRKAGIGSESPPDEAAAEGVAANSSQAMQKKVRGTCVNEHSLLATDYLNHFNEAMMILEIATNMPEVIEQAKEWRPKSYEDHFRDSGLSDAELIIEAYNLSPPKYRVPFDEAVASLNDLVQDSIDKIDTANEANDGESLRMMAQDSLAALRAKVESVNCIINGTTQTMGQDEIDSLFDD